MLMDIKCSVVSSVSVDLTFDDNTTKHAVLAVGDLINVEYNHNGCRKRCLGKVVKVSVTDSTDPKKWIIYVDSSEEFDSGLVRFSPASILDVEVLYKAETVTNIQTPKDNTGVPHLRIVKGRLQYSLDGVHWHKITVDREDIMIRGEEGTIPGEGCDDYEPPMCSGRGEYAIKDEEM